MSPPALARKPRASPHWRVIFNRIRERHWTESDQGVRLREGEHPLEAMLHWSDPTRRLKTLRRRRASLMDDNPSSG